MHRRARFLPVALVAPFLFSCASDRGLSGIDQNELQHHVEFLADDALEGRGTGEAGCEEAARYIAQHFARAGLQAGGDFGTYFQHFEATAGRQVADSTRVTLAGDELELDQDYAVSSAVGNSGGEGDLVFVGYGIAAPEHGRDDYVGLEVEGKILVALTGAPGRSREEGPYLDTAPGAAYAQDRKKIETAFARKAAGLVLVQGYLGEMPLELPAFDSDRGAGLSFPAIVLPADLGEALLAKAALDLAPLEQELDAGAVKSQALTGLSASLHLAFEPIVRPTSNVIGILPGHGPQKDEVIVLGAHYDHLGYGGSGSLAGSRAIHNGADDNASGTAALLELADACSQLGERQNRTLVFIAFSGEELGLLGSAFYVENPVRPIEDTAAMLNFDMIGRSSNGYCAVGAGGCSPDFDGLAEAVNAAQGLGLNLEISDGGMTRGSSDHQSFLNADVPSLFFFSGLHEDYHQPSDDADKVNAAGAESITRLAYGVLRELDGRRARPAFVALKPVNPHGGDVTSSGDTNAGGARPWFGSIPAFGGEEGDGVLFSGVTEGSPAWKAGLRGGDRLIEFDGQEVRTLEDFTVFLSAHGIGDTIPVVVDRDGERVEGEVTLALRPERR